jgi:hypothetical protein
MKLQNAVWAASAIVLTATWPASALSATTRNSQRVRDYLQARCKLETGSQVHARLISAVAQVPQTVIDAARKEIDRRKDLTGPDAQRLGTQQLKTYDGSYTINYKVWKIAPSPHNSGWFMVDVFLAGHKGQGYYQQMFVLAINPKSGHHSVVREGGLGISTNPKTSEFAASAIIAPWDVADVDKDGENEIIVSGSDSEIGLWGLIAYKPNDTEWKEIGSGCEPEGD